MLKRVTERKLVLVRAPTRLEDLIQRFNTQSQTQFYVEHLGADFSDYQEEHDTYQSVINAAGEILTALGPVQILERRFLPNFMFGPDDLVIAVGRDGLVANTLKYLDDQLLIGINPDPIRWDGILLPFRVMDLDIIVRETLEQKRPVHEVTMAGVELTDGQKLKAVNDFFIGQRTHVSSRYEISQADQREYQSSSGIIVSTGLGSTGWFKSIRAGARAIAGTAPKKEIKQSISKTGKHRPAAPADEALPWDTDFLQFAVREPFPSRTTGTSLTFGKITGDEPLRIISQMPENGVIFSDGIEADFLAFNSGMEAVVAPAKARGRLVG